VNEEDEMRIEHALRSAKPATSPGAAPRFQGRWKNDMGSTMELHVAPDGSLKGTYQTNVGAAKPWERFELSGYVAGDLIAFVANFGKYDSLTAWVGQHTVDGGRERIRTLWHLANNVPDSEEPTRLWSSILTGANDFERA
jgi:hypothetical protein